MSKRHGTNNIARSILLSVLKYLHGISGTSISKENGSVFLLHSTIMLMFDGSNFRGLCAISDLDIFNFPLEGPIGLPADGQTLT
jgi:hypothetical protein